MRRKTALRVLFDAALLLLFLFIFDRSLFFLITSARDHLTPVPPLEKKFEQIRNPQSRDILVLGTSRAYEGIHPRFLKQRLGMQAYKEAFIGKHPAYNYFFYRHYRQKVKIPRVAIYGVDYFIFKSVSDKNLMARFPEARVENPYHGSWSLLLANKAGIDEYLNDELLHLGDLMDGSDAPRLDVVPNQMDRYCGRNAEDEVDTDAPARYRVYHYKPYPGIEGVYLDKLLQSFEQDHVTVFLVLLPDFIGTYMSNYQQDMFLADIEGLAAKHTNVHVLNYDIPERFPLADPQNFLNGGYGDTNSHLSRIGARLFDDLLAADVKMTLSGKGKATPELNR